MSLIIGKINIRKYWEFLLSLIILWGFTILLLIQSLILNNGRIIYALDDAYIHLAIAKNFSQYGIWGVTNNEFSSSSSSLLYSLLLSLIFLFGPNENVPLILNLIFSNLILLEVYYIFKKIEKIPPYITFIGLILIIFLVPLPFLIFTGMEHTIQIFIDILFVYLTSKLLCENNSLSQKKSLLEDKRILTENNLILLISPLITMIRFEGMFLIFVVSALFFLRKKYKYAFLIITFGFIPIIIYGFISIWFGWYFLPNSIILKGNTLDLTSVKTIFDFFDFKMIIRNPNILILILGIFFIVIIQYHDKEIIWNEISIMALIFIFVAILHMFLIGSYIENQNFSRYDGYLTALAIVILLLFIKDYLPQNLSISQIRIYLTKIKANNQINIVQILAIIIIFTFLFWIYIPRSIYLLRRTSQATNNIYEQQYQMGLFLKKYYEGECVALNDIGAVNYLADIECLDLRGLGSVDIARSIMDDELDEEIVYKEAKRRDCKIAIIYENKDYGYDIPSEWTKVGEWKIKYNVVCGDDTVSFWAVDPDEIDDLTENLKDFSKYLPNTVIESGNYTS